MAIAIAWGWGRLPPESLLTQWYQARLGQGSARLRQIGIVALARQLLMALWRVLETGALPAGAVLKAEASGETAPVGAQVQRTRATVGSWCGALVAGHGGAERTD